LTPFHSSDEGLKSFLILALFIFLIDPESPDDPKGGLTGAGF